MAIEKVNGWSKDALRRAYSQYVAAMARRRAGSELAKSQFMNYVVGNYVFRHDGTYIFGQMGGGIFKVSHFAPKSLRGGIAAVKALLDLDQAVVLAVTEDMANMLKKMGYESEISIPTTFREEECDKFLFTNDICLEREFRAKATQISQGRANVRDFDFLLNCASLEWAESRYGWARFMN